MYNKLTHGRNFIFVSDTIHVQRKNGKGIVRGGKMTGVEMSGMGIFRNSDDTDDD